LLGSTYPEDPHVLGVFVEEGMSELHGCVLAVHLEKAVKVQLPHETGDIVVIEVPREDGV
jgi:hypothetical protein